MGLRRKRHDQVEIVVLEIVQRSGMTLAQRQALLRQHGIDEWVALAGAHAGRSDEDSGGQHPARQLLGHWRAHGIHAAHEQDRAGQGAGYQG